ncbi:DNA polymerase-3 subunit alpha (Gram-positive type) [Clostridiales Family XIII bacterium PM5-7]
MKDIISSSIQWDTIGAHDISEYQLDISGAVIAKETEMLTITLRLNFVIPYLDMEKMKAVILHQIPNLKGVNIQCQYEQVILTNEEIARLFIPHMIHIINGKYAAITKAIQPEKYELVGDTLNIHVLGRLATEQLNQKVAVQFTQLLKEHFDLPLTVHFEHDDEAYNQAAENWRATEDEDIKQSLKEQAEKVAEAKKNMAERPADGENKSYGGGNGNGGGWKRREKEQPAEGNRIMGKDISGTSVELSGLKPDTGVVVIEGILFNKDARAIKNEKKLVTLMVTDKKTSVCLKAFTSDNKWNEIDTLLKSGDYIKVRGETEWDRYDNCLVIMVKDIEKGEIKRREDIFDGLKRVELHAHTKMSAMDGLNDVETLVETAAFWGQPAVAITDHGVVQSFPDAAKTAKKLKGRENPIDIKIIYGMEGYVFDDADCHAPDGTIDYKKKNTNHIILLAKSQEGLKNIYKLVSYSHLNYFYKRPRLPKSVIAAHREGLIIGSACEAGDVYRAILEGKSEEELLQIASFYDYLEVQPLINNQFMIDKGIVNDTEDLKEINRKIVALADQLNIPAVATTDAHYDEPESAIYRNIIMAGQGYKDAENGQGLYMRTTEEMLEAFSYFGDRAYELVVTNTNKIADMVEEGILPVPKGKFPPKIEGADETLRSTCMEKAYSIYGEHMDHVIEERLDKELNSIIDNGYAVMYVSAQLLVQKSLQDGYLVGSRGSVGSSFAATMAGITEVNPLDPHYICPNCKHFEWGDMNLYDCGIDMPERACPECGKVMDRDGYTIPFATFLGFDGDKEPDIDLNFAGEYQSTAHKYVGTLFGEENVYKAGTVGTIANKTAYGYVRKFFDETQRPINKFEADRLTKGCQGVKRTTGQHPGGIIIVPDDHEIYEFCPVQHPANDVNSDIITTHFDYHKIDENLLKLDLLGHNIPSMIRQLQDMTDVDPLKIDLTDKKVLSIFNGIEALEIQDEEYPFTHGSYAIPEFGTPFVRQMLDDIKPDKFADLVRISGFSHGTDVWLNNAQDYIRDGTATMREVISTRDDIMNYLQLKGLENKMAFQIMEDVRKNRPLKEEQLKVMKEHGIPDWYVDSCIKIQYMFPRAHAVAYVMMSFRMAWYKVYYPVEFYATYFTSTVANFDAETILKGPKACLERIETINLMGDNATQKEKEDILNLEVACEMYARGYAFSEAKLGKSHGVQFWVDEGKVLLPFVALEGVGETAAKALTAAYEEMPFHTIEEAIKRAKLNKTAVEGLRNHGVFAGLPETDQLSLF